MNKRAKDGRARVHFLTLAQTVLTIRKKIKINQIVINITGREREVCLGRSFKSIFYAAESQAFFIFFCRCTSEVFLFLRDTGTKSHPYTCGASREREELYKSLITMSTTSLIP